MTENHVVHRAVLPQKTAWTVLWVAVLGFAAFVINVTFFEGTVETIDPVSSPALISTGKKESSVQSLESDAEFFARMRDISAPRQRLDYKSYKAIETFVRDLQELSYGGRDEPVRIIHYGDSILTTDELSGRVRYILQREFGDGGHGFVLLAKPWRWYSHKGVEMESVKKTWRIHPFTSSPLKDGLYGLGGVAFVARRGTRARAWVGTSKEGRWGRNVKWFDISYLEQPNGGSFDVYVNGDFRETVETEARHKKVAHHRVKVEFGHSKLKVESNNDGRLRLFGTILENGQPGVVYDSLAINGASGTALARFEEEHWKKEIAYRRPSLIMIMMGANEGANKYLNIGEYKKDFSRVVQTIRNAGNGASCLIAGPLDQAKKAPEGGLESKRMPARLSRAQKEVALEQGCAFFDTYNAMGGDGSMARWCTSGLGGGDLIHPTKSGSKRIGNWIAESLLYEYQSFGKSDKSAR